nr:MAG TPA: hypothetical protein [Caudoviricetes sp.]
MRKKYSHIKYGYIKSSAVVTLRATLLSHSC